MKSTTHRQREEWQVLLLRRMLVLLSEFSSLRHLRFFGSLDMDERPVAEGECRPESYWSIEHDPGYEHIIIVHRAENCYRNLDAQ